MADIFDRYQVVDTDTHISEPPDVWTARVSSKWGDLVPHVVRDPNGGPKDWWCIGDTQGGALPSGCIGGIWGK